MNEMIEQIKQLSVSVTENEYNNYMELSYKLLVKLHDAGAEKDSVYQPLSEYLGGLEDGISYNFISDTLDFVTGWCSPEKCIWNYCLFDKAKELFSLNDYECFQVAGHEGGRNLVYVCSKDGEKEYVLRMSALGDRDETEYLAETEFVRYLAEHGAPVADVIPSVHGNLVEVLHVDGKVSYISKFAYAKGMLISDNGYRYREGAPLEEYFFNTGKALGAIHRLSKRFEPKHNRISYFEKYNEAYINQLIPDCYNELKQVMFERLIAFRQLPVDDTCFGLVHFDFSDGNYHIDMSTGEITAYDFDNCMYCWYMFDLANLWTHGVGWCRFIEDGEKRMEYMGHYFDTVLQGYRSETEVTEELLDKLPLFIDMVLIENIVDEFECCAREEEELDYEDIEDAAECLIHKIPYAGVGEE